MTMPLKHLSLTHPVLKGISPPPKGQSLDLNDEIQGQKASADRDLKGSKKNLRLKRFTSLEKPYQYLRQDQKAKD